MSVLQKLYRGELLPADYEMPKSAEYDQAMKEYLMVTEKLHQALSEEQRELFERYKSASAEVENLEQEDYFCKGIVLGARLMQEIEGDNKKGNCAK